MENLWSVEDDRSEDNRDNIGGDDAPVASLQHPCLVCVRGADGIVALNSDSDSQEDTSSDCNMTNTITPGTKIRKESRDEDSDTEEEVGEDDNHVSHAEEHKQMVEHIPHIPED